MHGTQDGVAVPLDYDPADLLKGKRMKTMSGSFRVNILYVVWSLEIAGAEKLAYDMIRALPADRFRVIVCSVNKGGLLGERLRNEGVTVYHREKGNGLDWGAVGWLRDIIRRERVTVIHAHQYSPMVYAVLASWAMRHVRVVFTEHGRNYPEQRRWKRELVNPFLARGLDRIVAISASTRGSMMEYDRLPGDRIRVIHNGVNPEHARGSADVSAKRRELGIPEGHAVVGTATRFEPVKNLPLLLHAFRTVLTARPNTCLVLAGAGSLERELRDLARTLEMETRVHFIGLRHDLPDIYGVMDVFVLSSHTEGISIALLEAMANGVPAVVTAVGGNPEVVLHGETGFVVPAGDDGAMAERVLSLLDNPQRGGEIGRNGMRRVEKRFSFDRMMAEYLALYGADDVCPEAETEAIRSGREGVANA